MPSRAPLLLLYGIARRMAPAFASMILLRATPRATQATTACARAHRPVYILLIDGPVKLSLAPSPPAQFAPTLIPFRSSSIHPKSRQVRHPEPVQSLTFGCEICDDEGPHSPSLAVANGCRQRPARDSEACFLCHPSPDTLRFTAYANERDDFS